LETAKLTPPNALGGVGLTIGGVADSVVSLVVKGRLSLSHIQALRDSALGLFHWRSGGVAKMAVSSVSPAARPQ